MTEGSVRQCCSSPATDDAVSGAGTSRLIREDGSTRSSPRSSDTPRWPLTEAAGSMEMEPGHGTVVFTCDSRVNDR